LALQNAHSALERHQSQAIHQKNRWQQFLHYFQLPPSATRLLCLDVSHSLGECTVVSCVILDEAIPQKNLYRRFSIEEGNGDDCQALKIGFTRYYAHSQETQEKWPDAILVDGGKGQLNALKTTLEALGEPIGILLGMAKGQSRKPGQETLFQWHDSGIQEAILQKDQPLFHLLQHIRDEAHKTALQRHRQQRLQKRTQSPLENIPGVGPKRRQALLAYFGGYQGLKEADIATLAKVPFISRALAEVIFKALRP
jgi:excinuclease ABC subunit C